MWPFGSRADKFVGDEFEDIPSPFWETDVVAMGEREKREPNYYEGLQPLWPKLGQLMVRSSANGGASGDVNAMDAITPILINVRDDEAAD